MSICLRTVFKAAPMHGVEANSEANMCRDAVGSQHHVVRCMGWLHTPTNGWDHWKQPQGFFDHSLSNNTNLKIRKLGNGGQML